MPDWSSLLRNLQANNKVADDATTQLVDRARMAVNPNIQGPPLPNESTPEELKYSQAIGQGVMGVAAPAKIPALAKIAPEIPAVVETGNTMWKNMLETQVKNRAADSANRLKFQMLKKKLGGY